LGNGSQRDRPRAFLRLPIVRNARNSWRQLDGSREFAALLVGGADRGGLRFGDDVLREWPATILTSPR
jgi:hypothetical protein